MITAKEYCRKNQNSNHPDMISELLIGFAKEAIKADRINLLEHIEINDYDVHEEYSPSVDKESVINAPQINLS